MTNKERIEDLFTEFDEFGMQPTILVPDPEEMAKAWKHELEYETKLLRDEGEAWHKKCKELEIELDAMRGAANSLKMHYEDARSEVDNLTYKLECLLCHATGGVLSKHTYDLSTMESVVTDYINETYNDGYAEGVREIFTELEKRFGCVAEHGYVGFLDALEELKKEYMEGKCG